MKKKHILVAGGAGYIGSHMVRLLLKEGYQPVVFDNLATGHKDFIPKGCPFFKGDLKIKKDIDRCFKKYPIDTVMYFAASLVVPESVANPLKYYENNVSASVLLLQSMVEHKIGKIIFSSTAAVYGEPDHIPVTEDSKKVPTNPYGSSKLMIEQILKDVAFAHDFRFISLRYFNVAGSGPGEETGIRYKEITHLVPSILKVASGERSVFNVFGDDYSTEDGTCVRDFIYIMDLCRAHLMAIKYLDTHPEVKSDVFNLGNGDGFSVKQVMDASEKVTGKKINAHFCPRRPGDPAKIVASSEKAQRILGWKPQVPLSEIIESAWRWELKERERKLRAKKK